MRTSEACALLQVQFPEQADIIASQLVQPYVCTRVVRDTTGAVVSACMYEECVDNLLVEPMYYIFVMWLASSVKNKGYGTRVLNLVHKDFPDIIFALTVHKANVNAIRFYERLGYCNQGLLSSCTDYVRMYRRSQYKLDKLNLN